MRQRLSTALDTLLKHHSLLGRPIVEPMAAVVLLAKSPAGESRLELRAGELARWLGVSESYVDHRVLPALRGSGAVTTEVVKTTVDGVRRVAGLRWELLPLTDARSQRGHALALEKRELAVLLAVCEALFAPGWAPVGKRETPAGLLGARRGRGAAAERLALLRMVLAARPNGQVRLVGGSVAAGFDRADATVARLLGCSLEGAARVVDGLIRQGVLEVSGRGRSGDQVRVMVPAVAAAHGRGPATPLQIAPEAEVIPAEDASAAEGRPGESRFCARCCAVLDEPESMDLGAGWIQEGFFEVLEGGLVKDRARALRDQYRGDGPNEEPNTPCDLGEQAAPVSMDTVPAGAPHHADHAPVVAQSGSGAAVIRFSGEAASESCGRTERAGEREDQPGSGRDRESGPADGRDGPLRGEQHPNGTQGQHAGFSSVVPGRAPLRWSLPRGLEQVLEPVQLEWARIAHAGARRQVQAVVATELQRLAGIVGPGRAAAALAERLRRRLSAQHGEPIREPVGWFLRRGVPQRADCYALECDEGVRMDTGRACPSCELLIGDRRALRHRIAEALACELPRLASEEFRLELERRLGHEVARQAELDALRRERGRVERARREESLAQRRDESALAAAELAARPCEGCGVPESGGLCLVCSQSRATRRALDQAVEIAATRTAPEDGLATEAERLASSRARMEAVVQEAEARLRGEGVAEAGMAWQVRILAEQLLQEQRDGALGALLGGSDAQAEAERAYAAEWRHRQRHGREQQTRAAEQAAEQARRRCAELLLAEQIAQIRQASTAGQVPTARTGRWAGRLAILAQRPLESELHPGNARAGECQEAVSAA